MDRYVHAALGPEAEPLHRVLGVVYERLRLLAGAHLRGDLHQQTLQATALANEAVLRLLRAPPRAWTDVNHVVRTASRVMRQVLVDHARARGRIKRGGGAVRLPLDEVVLAYEGRSADMLDVDAALERLQALDEDAARLVELRFFLGLTVEEAATVLDRPVRTVERDWTTVRAWLGKELRSHG